MSRTLIAYTNPWSFAIAVERALAAAQIGSIVDVIDLHELCEHSALFRRIDRWAEAANRKFQRFIVPAVTGRDITAEVRNDLRPFDLPPLPDTPEALRAYTYHGAPVGLAVLSSVTSLTTVQNADSLAEFGASLYPAWRTAHLSAQVGRAIESRGYEAAYIFNGRHCISRPFCEIVERTAPVYRYEQGGSGNRYIISRHGVHDPHSVAKLVEEHKFDFQEGNKFWLGRLSKLPGSGVELFTATQVKGLIPGGIEPDQTISFFTTSSDELVGIRDTVAFGEFDSQYAVAQTIAEECAACGANFVLRLHPHLQYKHPSWIREWNFDRLEELGATIVMPQDPVDTYALIAASRCVLTCGSTVGFEASYMGVPAAEVGDFVGGVLGAVGIVRDRQQIRNFISDPQRPAHSRDQTLRFGSYCKSAGTLLPNLNTGTHPYFATIDGRVVDPVRYIYQRLRSLFLPSSQAVTPHDGKILVEPSVLKELSER